MRETRKGGKKTKGEKARDRTHFGSHLELLCPSLLLGLFRSLRLHKSFIPLVLRRRRATYISQKCQEEQRTVTTEGCSFRWFTEEKWLLSQWNSKKDTEHRSPGKQFYSAERSPCDWRLQIRTKGSYLPEPGLGKEGAGDECHSS